MTLTLSFLKSCMTIQFMKWEGRIVLYEVSTRYVIDKVQESDHIRMKHPVCPLLDA